MIVRATEVCQSPNGHSDVKSHIDRFYGRDLRKKKHNVSVNNVRNDSEAAQDQNLTHSNYRAIIYLLNSPVACVWLFVACADMH